jgi:hypothetical protein
MRETLQDIGAGSDFPDRTPKLQETKANIDKHVYLKLKQQSKKSIG